MYGGWVPGHEGNDPMCRERWDPSRKTNSSDIYTSDHKMLHVKFYWLRILPKALYCDLILLLPEGTRSTICLLKHFEIMVIERDLLSLFRFSFVCVDTLTTDILENILRLINYPILKKESSIDEVLNYFNINLLFRNVSSPKLRWTKWRISWYNIKFRIGRYVKILG